ncbi:MAG: phage holin family protein [Opitutaceae bacterium]
MNFPQLLKSSILIALGVVFASSTSKGIAYDSTTALVVAAILLSLCNVFLKPLLMVFSLPFIVLTFGIGIWLINALLFLLVSGIVQGFHVASFSSALWGALVVSLTSAFASLLFGKSRVNVQVGGTRPQNPSTGPSSQAQQTRRPLKDDDVIDI